MTWTPDPEWDLSADVPAVVARDADWYAERLRKAGMDPIVYSTDPVAGQPIWCCQIRMDRKVFNDAPTPTEALRAAWEAAGEP